MSAAGKRAGIKDGTRSGLWSVMASAIEELRPQIVVIENVRGLLSAEAHRNVEPENATVGNGGARPILRAIGAVVGSLADLGYMGGYTTIAAADIGAPHRRERVFILAADADNARRREQCWPFTISTELTAAQHGSDSAISLLPTPRATNEKGRRNPNGRSRDGRPRTSGDDALPDALCRVGPKLLPTPSTDDATGARTPEQRARMSKAFSNLNDTAVNELLSTPQSRDAKGAPKDGFNNSCLPRDIIACDQSWGKYEQSIRRWEAITRVAPKPTEPGVAGKKQPRLYAPFSEWMMGWPESWCTDPAIGINRRDQLRIIGNGVVPQQAEAALRHLIEVQRQLGGA